MPIAIVPQFTYAWPIKDPSVIWAARRRFALCNCCPRLECHITPSVATNRIHLQPELAQSVYLTVRSREYNITPRQPRFPPRPPWAHCQRGIFDLLLRWSTAAASGGPRGHQGAKGQRSRNRAWPQPIAQQCRVPCFGAAFSFLLRLCPWSIPVAGRVLKNAGEPAQIRTPGA